MPTLYQISFTDKSIAADGNNIDEQKSKLKSEIEKQISRSPDKVARLVVNGSVQEIRSGDIEDVLNSIRPLQQIEKDFLRSAFHYYGQTKDLCKDITSIMEVMDCLDQIKNSDGNIEVSQSDIDKAIKAIEHMEQRPNDLFLCKNLIGQLKNPIKKA